MVAEVGQGCLRGRACDAALPDSRRSFCSVCDAECNFLEPSLTNAVAFSWGHEVTRTFAEYSYSYHTGLTRVGAPELLLLIMLSGLPVQGVRGPKLAAALGDLGGRGEELSRRAGMAAREPRGQESSPSQAAGAMQVPSGQGLAGHAGILAWSHGACLMGRFGRPGDGGIAEPCGC
jgi:hypothetical protein